jgi:hypothetical protein
MLTLFTSQAATDVLLLDYQAKAQICLPNLKKKHVLMSVTFPRYVTKFYEKRRVKNVLWFDIRVGR